MTTVKSTTKEKIFYGFGNMGSYILWAFTAAYVTAYVTDCIHPEDWLISLFGTIILVCRFFDGLSDIGMGLLIEHTHSKLGKARFWFGISIIPLCIVFFFLFFMSGMDQVASIVGLSIMYFLFTVIFYTMNNIGFNAMLPRLSNDPYDQSNMCTINSIFTSVGGLFSGIALTVIKAFGGNTEQSAWTKFVVMLLALALVGQVLCFFFVKEKPAITSQSKPQSKQDVHLGLKALFHTKYFYIAIAMFTINYYISLSVTTSGQYYATYVLGNVNYFSIFGIVPMVTMAIGLLLTPVFVKKISKRFTLALAVAFVAAGNILGSCFPYVWQVGLAAVLIKGFGSAVVMSQFYTLAPDMVAYVEAKEGIRVEGLAASANSFGCKIGSGLGSAVVLWVLPMCGYNVENGMNQPNSAIYAFITLYWWVPTALSVVLFLLAFSWDIDKKTKALVAEKSVAQPIQ